MFSVESEFAVYRASGAVLGFMSLWIMAVIARWESRDRSC